MGLQDELEPILAKIRTEANNSWQKYLTGIPDKEDHAAEWQKIGTEFFGTVDDLLTRFRRYYAFDSHDFSVNVNQLASPKSGALVDRPMGGTAVGSVFSASDNYMAGVSTMIHAEQWNGPSAKAFQKDFLEPFGTASKWQQAYIKELATAAAALQVASSRTKRAIKFVAESCLGALTGDQKYQGDLGFADTSKDLPGKDVADGLGIITGVAGLFLGGPVGLVIGAVGLVSGLYGAGKQGSTEPHLQVEYRDDPQSVVKQTEYAIKALEEWLLDEDEKLGGALNKDLESPDAFASPFLKLPAPGVTSGTYKELGIRDAPGGDDQVVVSLVQLGRCGAYNLPGAAYEYDAAANQVDACQIPGSMSVFFPRTISPFNSSVDNLVRIMHGIRDGLNRAGDAMLTAARNYEGTDAQQAAVITEISKIAPHHSIAPTK
ncbi:hypothetical protein AB0M47_08045 [Hamadaea sp. NPDC051192]|uniref:hypothetical protein n=1 Tax=Hamadaea sp. NPDC051192 TaxID=3154940 RepID=UPI003418365B